jgi:DNA-3-methyladenine glycosylase II
MRSSEALRHLAAADQRLAKVILAVGECTIKVGGEPFQSLVESIIYQQLAGKAADAIYGRFLNLYGGSFPSPGQLLSKSDADFRSCGLSGRKTAYIKDLALHIIEGRLALDKLPLLTDEQVIQQLTAVRGIGRWTAEMFLIFCLGRPDILPVQDLGLRKAIQKTYCLHELPSPDAMNKITDRWRPYRSIATWYLWKSLERLTT